uniref:hypothetical protein n=1 Tax=Sulfurimonas sp. TaxID=2022749 RepID=UPI0025F4E05D
QFYNLSELENSSHENEALEIDAEYEKFEDELKGKLKELENFIKTLKYNENKIDLEILEQKEISKGSYEGKIKLIEAQKEVKIKAIFSLEKKLKTLQSNRVEHASKCRKHEERYLSLRESNAKILASRRRDLNENILNARAIAYPIENSFNEFLSDEIDGWEKEIYPIIDKNLLKMSCSELHPEVIDSKNPLGFKINVDALDTIPTKDEALEIIKRYKTEKNEILKNSKEVYRNEIGKLDEKKNRLLSDLEVCDKEIENAIDEKVNLVAEEEKNSHIISALIEELKGELISISDKYKNKREKIYKELDEFNTRVNTCNNDIKMNKTNKREKITKSANNRNFNIDLLKKSETKKAQDVIKIEENKIEDLKASMESMSEDEMIDELSKEIGTLKEAFFKSSDAKRYLKEYEDTKPMITQLPSIQAELTKKEKISANRKEMIKRLGKLIAERTSELNIKKAIVEKMLTKYNQGLNKIKELDLDISEDKIATEEMLIDLIIAYENTLREYGNKKSKLRGCIDRLKKLEPHSLIELNLNLDGFGETESIAELENIMDSLGELENFEKNKYESIKKQNHNDFSTFLRSTIPGKLQSFDDLESRFEKAKSSMNKTLSHADFGVIKEIRLITDSSKARNNSIASLLQDLSKKTKDTVNLYSSKSLFYQDIPKSVENIRDIQDILEEIKKKGSSGAINLFDTIDLSMSYIENGKKVENKLNIKNESSSGGNILLKVAIAMSILSRYVKTISKESPFFLIIDEISKLQSKNQDLIREYINENGFKTLFITPDPAYPDPERAIYYTFKNIQEDGEMLEIRQMNII